MDILIWPIVALITFLILGIVFIISLRPAFLRLIDRIKSGGFKGDLIRFESDSGPKKSQETAQIRNPDKPLTPTESWKRENLDNKLLKQREEDYRVALKINSEYASATSDEKEEFLINLVASLSVSEEFHTIYTTISGSQISVLQLAVSELGVEKNRIEVIYDLAVSSYGKAYEKYAFEDWLKFLISISFIEEIVGTGKFRTTLRGREFVKYMVDKGYDFHKPY